MKDPIDKVTLPLDVNAENSISTRFASPDRIYAVQLKKDLFEDWVVVQAWSGRSNRRGRTVTTPVGTYAAGIAYLETIARKRRRRGYDLVSF